MGDAARRVAVIVSCEHGGNRVPEWLAARFAGANASAALESHRGWDPGAWGMAQELCGRIGFDAAIARTSRYIARVSRLVVDLNRSEGHPQLLSEFTRDLPEADRERVMHEHYFPHRERVERGVRESVEKGLAVVHVSVHTFTAVLGAERRRFDAGVLFDPEREPEARFARAWIEAMRAGGPPIDVRENQPYLGTDDGLTTTLRGMFAPGEYIGVEVEVRNDLVCEEDDQARWGSRLAASLMRVIRIGCFSGDGG